MMALLMRVRVLQPDAQTVQTNCSIGAVDSVSLSSSAGVARVTMDRPESLNAWTPDSGGNSWRHWRPRPRIPTCAAS